jgi:uncharacterized protein (TIGR02246 family)
MSNPRSRALPEDEEKAVRELVERASAAQSDPDALIPMHTEDAVVVNFFGRRILGREAFEEAMRAALSTPLRDITTTVEIVDIRAVSDSVALVSCIKTTHDNRDGDDGAELPATSGAMSYVVTKADDGWRIALAQTTPIRH